MRDRGVGSSSSRYFALGDQLASVSMADVTTIEISTDLHERLESHVEEGETVEEFLEELVNIYETEGAFLQEGYSE